MSETPLHLLLDQNVPHALTDWLRAQRPQWTVQHVNDLGFAGRPDQFLYRWALEQQAIVVTYDEDFADVRFYPIGKHHGVVRLRVWPTTQEKTIEALGRLLEQLPAEEWPGRLIIIDNQKIRVRRIA